MPTRPRDQQVDVLVEPWRYPRHALHQEPLLSWRAARGNPALEHRQATLASTLGHVVRFYVTYDPTDRRELFVHSVEIFPGPNPSATDLRVPLVAFLRIVRHAIARGDVDVHAFYELRDGKLHDREAELLAPSPPPRRRYRDPAIQASLDEVAEIYKANPKAPTQAVERALKVSWRTASRRVAAARAEGLIPPLDRNGTRGGTAVRSKRERKRR
jgi:hypothetical protein